MTYCFRTMVATHPDGTKVPMRVDAEAGMIDVWSNEANDWIWSTHATKCFFGLSLLIS